MSNLKCQFLNSRDTIHKSKQKIIYWAMFNIWVNSLVLGLFWSLSAALKWINKTSCPWFSKRDRIQKWQVRTVNKFWSAPTCKPPKFFSGLLCTVMLCDLQNDLLLKKRKLNIKRKNIIFLLAIWCTFHSVTCLDLHMCNSGQHYFLKMQKWDEGIIWLHQTQWKEPSMMSVVSLPDSHFDIF